MLAQEVRLQHASRQMAAAAVEAEARRVQEAEQRVPEEEPDDTHGGHGPG